MRRVFKSEFFRGQHQVVDSIGEVAGYRILAVLGYGAGSTVYEVQDPEDGALYALKVVAKNLPTDQRFVDQAANEHAVGGRLIHPLLRRSLKIIREGSLIATNKFMLLLELVDGVTLETRRPRSRRRMVELFGQVAQGLEAMHEAGFVHADMKPINILLMNNGGLKIIDFGQSCPAGTIKTRIQGTLDYIAPEQVKRGPITPRTDIYNLGATMYWCVTDRHPPTALRLRSLPGQANAQPARDVDTVLRDPRDHNPNIPPAMAGLILDCLKPEPAARPQSMREVRYRLDLAMFQLENERRRTSGVAALADAALPDAITPVNAQAARAPALSDIPPELLINAEPPPQEPVAVPQMELAGMTDANAREPEIDLPYPAELMPLVS